MQVGEARLGWFTGCGTDGFQDKAWMGVSGRLTGLDPGRRPGKSEY